MGKRRDKSVSELVRKLPDNDPNQTTIDHVVPISKGGGDEDANLRLAHARCNHARSNTLDPGPW